MYYISRRYRWCFQINFYAAWYMKLSLLGIVMGTILIAMFTFTTFLRLLLGYPSLGSQLIIGGMQITIETGWTQYPFGKRQMCIEFLYYTDHNQRDNQLSSQYSLQSKKGQFTIVSAIFFPAAKRQRNKIWVKAILFLVNIHIQAHTYMYVQRFSSPKHMN